KDARMRSLRDATAAHAAAGVRASPFAIMAVAHATAAVAPPVRLPSISPRRKGIMGNSAAPAWRATFTDRLRAYRRGRRRRGNAAMRTARQRDSPGPVRRHAFRRRAG